VKTTKTKEKDFNITHPELKEGEVFIYTTTKLGYEGIRKQWKTARKGIIGYATNGEKLIDEYFPIFVSIKEKEERHAKSIK